MGWDEGTEGRVGTQNVKLTYNTIGHRLDCVAVWLNGVNVRSSRQEHSAC